MVVSWFCYYSTISKDGYTKEADWRVQGVSQESFFATSYESIIIPNKKFRKSMGTIRVLNFVASEEGQDKEMS